MFSSLLLQEQNHLCLEILAGIIWHVITALQKHQWNLILRLHVEVSNVTSTMNILLKGLSRMFMFFKSSHVYMWKNGIEYGFFHDYVGID